MNRIKIFTDTNINNLEVRVNKFMAGKKIISIMQDSSSVETTELAPFEDAKAGIAVVDGRAYINPIRAVVLTRIVITVWYKEK